MCSVLQYSTPTVTVTHCIFNIKQIITVPLEKWKSNVVDPELVSNAALKSNVNYQLALSYVPVHLSLYVAEQGARFL